MPEVIVKGTKNAPRTFMYGFAVSTLLSGGNLVSGFIGGSLAVIAGVIREISVKLFEKLRGHFSHSLDSSNRKYVVAALTLAGTYSIGRLLGLAINFRASVITTVALYLLRLSAEDRNPPVDLVFLI